MVVLLNFPAESCAGGMGPNMEVQDARNLLAPMWPCTSLPVCVEPCFIWRHGSVWILAWSIAEAG